MGKFDLYKLDLKGMQVDTLEKEYLLDNGFFANIDGEEIQKGKVNVTVSIKRTAGMFNIDFQLTGSIYIPCDRCLDDMELPIDEKSKLVVKFGRDYSEESDEIVVIPETEGVINLAWFLYEFVALAIPIKHVHMPGKCNKDMSSKLDELMVQDEEDDEIIE